MKLLAIILTIMGITKFGIAHKVDKSDFYDLQNRREFRDINVYNIVVSMLILEGLSEIICGIFILL